jgi:hypothetical protein
LLVWRGGALLSGSKAEDAGWSQNNFAPFSDSRLSPNKCDGFVAISPDAVIQGVPSGYTAMPRGPRHLRRSETIPGQGTAKRFVPVSRRRSWAARKATVLTFIV